MRHSRVTPKAPGITWRQGLPTQALRVQLHHAGTPQTRPFRRRSNVTDGIGAMSPRRWGSRTALTFGALFGLAMTAGAQSYPFSQRGSVSQSVAFTSITVTYGRPIARGRVLFGQLVPWDSVWHPGADSATRITFDHDVLIEGHALKAGEYSLWLVPHETRPWTLIFSRAVHVFHKPYPGPADDALRVDIVPERGGHMETLAIYFPVVQRDQAVMRIHWGETIVPIRLQAPYRPPD
jgi:hypothetical protein